MKFLVTGGAGFIGSNLSQALVEKGYSVRVLDNFSTGKRSNIREFEDRIELIEGDIRDMATVRRAVEGVDYVMHLAALPSVDRSVRDPVTSNQVNVDGTLNVLVASRDAGVKRVVYAGSSSAYGDTPTLPKREDMPPNPKSPYAAQKLMGEYYCRIFYELYGLETVVLRYFNIFGPRQDSDSNYSAVIPRFITALLEGRSPTIYGDGLQSRDFTYVENAVEATISAAFAPDAKGQVINVACGGRITLNELVDKLQKILGSDIPPVYAPPRPGDVRHSMADIGKARNLLGYEPKVDIEEGLRRTVGFFRMAIA